MYPKTIIIRKPLFIMDIFKTPLLNKALFTTAILTCSSFYAPKTLIIRKALFIIAKIKTLLIRMMVSTKAIFNPIHKGHSHYGHIQNAPFKNDGFN